MTIRNINPEFGSTDATVTFADVGEMSSAILACGYAIPEDGLVEGRDYETVSESIQATVIFDNGGGTTVQLTNGAHKWSHYYDDSADAAADVRNALTTGSFYDFDGNEPEAMDLAPTSEELRSGGYRVERFASTTQLDEHANDHFQSGWGNEREFARKNLKSTLFQKPSL